MARIFCFVALMALGLAACQSASGPAAEPGATATAGSTTITTSGSVRADAVYVAR